MFWNETRDPGTGPEMDENAIYVAWQAGLGFFYRRLTCQWVWWLIFYDVKVALLLPRYRRTRGTNISNFIFLGLRVMKIIMGMAGTNQERKGSNKACLSRRR